MADDDDEWRFSVEEVGSDDAEADSHTTDGTVTMVGEDDDGPTVGVTTEDPAEVGSDEEGNVGGTLVPEMPVEPGTPEAENVAFATAGAALTALVFAGVVTQLDPVTVGAVAGSVVAGATLLYLLFRRF